MPQTGIPTPATNDTDGPLECAGQGDGHSPVVTDQSRHTPEPDARSGSETLTALDARHPYRAVAEGTYLPKIVDTSDPGSVACWDAARPVAVAILTAALDGPHSPVSLPSARAQLCTYLHWQARQDIDFLTTSSVPDVVQVVLADAEIDRYLATDGAARRNSHRSRVAMRSMLASFRAAYPTQFPPPRTRRRGAPADPILAPVEDWQADIALDVCRTLRNPGTRNNARALILTCRGTGADGGDLRHIRGTDIARRPGAGTWTTMTTPNRARDVPVLARYADALEDLAAGRPERCIISDVPAPCDPSAPSQLAGVINRALHRAGYDFTVSPERLRKAWLCEHLAANTPLNTLLAAAGLKTLHSIEGLLANWGPPVPTRPEHLAYELGGLIPRRNRTHRRNNQTHTTGAETTGDPEG